MTESTPFSLDSTDRDQGYPGNPSGVERLDRIVPDVPFIGCKREGESGRR
jgi:hypothetical protein